MGLCSIFHNKTEKRYDSKKHTSASIHCVHPKVKPCLPIFKTKPSRKKKENPTTIQAIKRKNFFLNDLVAKEQTSKKKNSTGFCTARCLFHVCVGARIAEIGVAHGGPEMPSIGAFFL